MKSIDRMFVITGLAFLLVGMALGIKMASSMDFSLRPVHAHLNLLGFAVMALYGLCYRSWPNMQQGNLPLVHYFLHTITVAVALTLLYFLIRNPDLAPSIAPVLHYVDLGIYASVILFVYIFFTRAKD